MRQHPVRLGAGVAVALALALTADGAVAAPRRACSPPTSGGGAIRADVAVVGADAAGLAAAVVAARRCLSVVLTTPDPIPGGMMTAGQIGFVDGSPVVDWPELPGSAAPNGAIRTGDGWGTTGGFWYTLRRLIAAARGQPGDLEQTIRFEPRVTVAAVQQLVASLPNLLVLTKTTLVAAHRAGSRVGFVTVRGGFDGTIRARYWVDGSDAGELVGALKLPYDLGNPGRAGGDGVVQAYTYRWTAVEGDVPGAYPTAPPQYYGVNRSPYRAITEHVWPIYERDFGVPASSAYAVNPFRLFNNQGRLNGPQQLPVNAQTGAPDPASPPEIWDVNSGANDARNVDIAAMLASDQDVASFFAARGSRDPYVGPNPTLAWCDVPWVEDRSGLDPAGAAFIVGKIEGAVKARALGLLWYIRSGDLLKRLHELPGGRNVSVRSSWSVLNELGSPDGMPYDMYQREGRRVDAVRNVSIYDLCPSFDADVSSGTGECSTPPRYFSDGIAVSDFDLDIHDTAFTGPVNLGLPWPHQVPFRALIPRGTTGLLVGGAIGADRLAYGALRVDPLRMMIGTAIGEAVAQAAKAGLSSFQKLDVERLRETLADDDQQTAFTDVAPVMADGHLGLVSQARVMQKLIARGTLVLRWNRAPAYGVALPSPAAPMVRSVRAALDRAIAGCPRSALPWEGDSATVTSLRRLRRTAEDVPATAGDAYRWLLDHRCTG
jgi:hypothetical protein